LPLARIRRLNPQGRQAVRPSGRAGALL
jgi:hypothetical protein